MHSLSIKLIFLLSTCNIFIGCSNKGESTASTTPKNISKVIPPEINSAKVDYNSLFKLAEQEGLELYNANEQILQTKENIEQLNAKVYLRSLLPELEEGVKRKILDGINHGLQDAEAIKYFIVIDSNIPDDSIESDIRFFELRKTSKAWSLSSVSSVWSCYKGRGHQDYSTQPCE